MAIRFACPACKTTYAVNPINAGKTLECRACGQSLRVPAPRQSNAAPDGPVPEPRPPFDAGQETSVSPLPDHNVPTRTGRAPSPFKRWRSLPTVKLLMVAATGLWLAAMPCIGCMSYLATKSRTKATAYEDLLFQSGYGDARLVEKKMDQESALYSAVVGGVIVPTIPFAIVMVALGVVHFATQTPRASDH